ncbi:MAG TPA: 16S rRNA (adenine(1518)-N(6)/adenine(1519)-N(6))-dimethyltransferase RsmA [Steroidobacteraceae bacterium]|nr:16S rRNA (adenine(1518)-N(6)/adenine(1519)-N(6))-dimethyltransferase RsmA [Steroidobacteraceae bacterium]
MPAGPRAGRPPRRKRFGQHFLHDPRIVDRILQSLDPQPGDHLVEIGPGRGALTARLLALPDCTLDAIEIDRDLAAELRAAFAGSPRHALHAADALAFDFGALACQRGGRLRIIGNLPYNISTPLLFHLLQQAEAILDMTLMLQREVVARLAAAPGSGDYGRLTVMLAPRVRVERLFDIGPGAFQPPPRVWSAVARLSARAEPLFEVSPRYAEVVAAAFSQRRKTLRNALSQILTAGQIRGCGIDPGVRPGTLTPEAFNRLAQAVDRGALDRASGER